MNYKTRLHLTSYILLLTSFYLPSFAQTYNYKGILRATATFASGYMPKENITNIYLTGELEYYPSENISIRGESAFFINTISEKFKPFDYNHALLTGVLFHFKPNNALDPYLGIQPGIALTRTNIIPFGYDNNHAAFNPLYCITGGINYYATRFFHLFVNLKYINGKHLSDAPSPLSLNEFRFSFGLGFNVNVMKKKE